MKEKEQNQNKIDEKKEELFELLCKKDYKKKPECAHCVFQRTNDCPYPKQLKKLELERE